jgi:hypothetical protein
MGDYRNMNFGTADPNAQGGSELIPDGTLAWAILTVRPYNDREILTPSKSSDGAYLDVELTILEGTYARRKVWDKIGLEGSDKWVARGMSSVRHILEVGRQMTDFSPSHPGYQCPTGLMELNELQCAVKIGVETGKGGYSDKNVIRQFLSPNPTSDTHKAFNKLVAGETSAPVRETKPAAAAKPAWGPGAGTSAATTQQTRAASPAGGRPTWAGARPSSPSAAAADRNVLDDDIPL